MRWRRPNICQTCAGRGIVHRSISVLGGISGRLPCKRCDGRGVR